MSGGPLRILQVNTLDAGGGAEKIAYGLHQAYQARGHQAWLAVGTKRLPDPTVIQIPPAASEARWSRFWLALHKQLGPLSGHLPAARRLRERLKRLAIEGWQAVETDLGWEGFQRPGSRQLLSLPPQRPDIIHGHNLHGKYFDLRVLASLSRQLPVFLTLHDAWLLSGHCAHSFACQRWLAGCGHCPDLGIPPEIKRDATAFNWRRKRRIYAQSRLYVATPSQWLMDKVKHSILAPAIVESRVIPYSVDRSIFKPMDRRAARAALGLPPDAIIFMFVANYILNNPWKDYETMKQAVRQVVRDRPNDPVLFIALGAPPAELRQARFEFDGVQGRPYESDPKKVAQYYQAADVYIHGARADTFPNTVLEALNCGLPVVATAVGGIPEQVEDQVTGFVVPPADPTAMASRLKLLVDDAPLRQRFGQAAAVSARSRYHPDWFATTYLEWYQASLDQRRRPRR